VLVEKLYAEVHGIAAGGDIIVGGMSLTVAGMCSLFAAEKDAYNVLLADTMPDVESGRIYAVTTKADILRI